MSYHFDYISKHDPSVQKAYNELLIIIGKVQNELHDKISFQREFIGSYSRNMITWDTKSNVGFDFDVNLIIQRGIHDFHPQEIRNMIGNALSKHAAQFEYSTVQSSTRVLTIKVIDHENSRIKHSCDFAIVYDYEDDEGYHSQDYIHFDKKHNEYTWCEQSKGFYMLPEKIEWLKENDLWHELRDYYLNKKNNNPNPKEFHSRDLFAQAVHETCQRNGYYHQ